MPSISAAVLAGPADRPGVGEEAALDDVVVEPGAPIPRGGGVVEARELGRPGVRLVGGPDAGGVLRDRAGGRGDGVADEGVVAPALLLPAVEMEPAAGVPGPVGAGVPERGVVAPRGETDGLQVRPRVRGGSRGEIDHDDAAREEAMVARVALDDDGAGAVGREREAARLPGGLVERLRRVVREIEPNDDRLVPAGAGVVLGDERDDGVGAVPVELPHAAVVRADLLGVVGCRIDQEEAAAGVAGTSDDRVGRRRGAVDGTGAPVEAVGPGIRGEDEETGAVARPGDALGGARQGGRELRFAPCGRHGVRKLMAGGDPIREERES